MTDKEFFDVLQKRYDHQEEDFQFDEEEPEFRELDFEGRVDRRKEEGWWI